jgi:hypothetical protein
MVYRWKSIYVPYKIKMLPYCNDCYFYDKNKNGEGMIKMNMYMSKQIGGKEISNYYKKYMKYKKKYLDLKK